MIRSEFPRTPVYQNEIALTRLTDAKSMPVKSPELKPVNKPSLIPLLSNAMLDSVLPTAVTVMTIMTLVSQCIIVLRKFSLFLFLAAMIRGKKVNPIAT